MRNYFEICAVHAKILSCDNSFCEFYRPAACDCCWKKFETFLRKYSFLSLAPCLLSDFNYFIFNLKTLYFVHLSLFCTLSTLLTIINTFRCTRFFIVLLNSQHDLYSLAFVASFNPRCIGREEDAG